MGVKDSMLHRSLLGFGCAIRVRVCHQGSGCAISMVSLRCESAMTSQAVLKSSILHLLRLNRTANLSSQLRMACWMAYTFISARSDAGKLMPLEWYCARSCSMRWARECRSWGERLCLPARMRCISWKYSWYLGSQLPFIFGDYKGHLEQALQISQGPLSNNCF